MPWERRYAFLLGLTGAAGALDALAFLHLGKVFASFQSGNVLFVGLGLGQGNPGLLVRAAVVVAAFALGAAAGAHLIGARLSPRGVAIELRIVALEAVLLLSFAGLWMAVGSPEDAPVVRVVMLAIGAGAMGIQAALALSLGIPEVATVALTATVAALGRRAGLEGRSGGAARHAGSTGAGHHPPSTGLLLMLVGVYFACAVVVATLPASSLASLIPLGLLVAGVAVDLARRRVPHPSGRGAEARAGAQRV